jgi:TPR repeat protein
MTIHVVSLGIILVLGARCAAQPTCARADAADPTIKVTRDFLQTLHHASKGDPEAQFRAGVSYETGCGVPQDYAQAIHWYRKAADNGHPGAQNSLGGLYLEGRGVEQSNEEAKKWYLRAASEGHPGAQNNLGYMYQTGRAGRDERDAQSSNDEAFKSTEPGFHRTWERR